MSLDSIKLHYQSLTGRDQKALQLLSLFLGVLILYVGLIAPSHQYYQSAKQSLTDNRELLTWIKQNAPQVKNFKAPTSSPQTDTPLIKQVSDLASNIGLKLSRVQPQGDDQLRVWIADTKYTDLIKLLSDLSSTAGIGIKQISIEKTKTEGLISAQFHITIQ